MASETKEILFGALVLMTLVLGIAWSYGMGKSHMAGGAEDYMLRASYNRIDGLNEGAEVRLGGIRVGTVESARLDDHFRVVVQFRIAKGVDLPLDSSAAIHTDGLFGGKYVVLEPGGDMANLKDGDELSFTQDAVIVSELLELIIAQGKARRAHP